MRYVSIVFLMVLFVLNACKKDEPDVPNTNTGVAGYNYTEVLLIGNKPPIMSGYINDLNEYVTISIPFYTSGLLQNKSAQAEILVFDQNGLKSSTTSTLDVYGYGSTKKTMFQGQQVYWPTNLKVSIAPYKSGIAIAQNRLAGPQNFASFSPLGNIHELDIHALTEGPNKSLFYLVSSFYTELGGNWQYVGPKIYQIDSAGNTSFYASIDSATAWFSGGGGGSSNGYIWYHNHNTMDMEADDKGNLWIVSPFVDAVILVDAHQNVMRGPAIENPVSITHKNGFLYVLSAHMHDPTNFSVVKHPSLWEIDRNQNVQHVHTFNGLQYPFQSGSVSNPSEGGLLMSYDAKFNIAIDDLGKFYLSSPMSGEVIKLK